jgi:putative addiction module component (TIGR02574 family)
MRRPDLWAELMELTPQERIKLAEDLWESIEPDRLPPLTIKELDELDRELAGHRVDPSDARSWETVRAWLQSRRR